MRTSSVNAFILARKLAFDYPARNGIAGEFVSICPRLIRGFEPLAGGKCEPHEAPFTRVRLSAYSHVDLFLPYRDFVAALKRAGVLVVDKQPRRRRSAAGQVAT